MVIGVVTTVGGVAVENQLDSVPFSMSVSVTELPKPEPVMATVAPALAAGGVKVIEEFTIKVALADAPLAATTMIL